MITDDTNERCPSEKRDSYTEYTDGSETVAVVQDTENDQAWIQSTTTMTIQQ